jgi:hypothetical protein
VLAPRLNEPDEARLDVPVPLWATVQNLGAATTSPVYLTVTLPVSPSFQSFTAPGWTCGGVSPGDFGGELSCSTPSLASGATSTVTVMLNALPTPFFSNFHEMVVSTGGQVLFSGNELQLAAHSANRNPWDVEDESYYFEESSGVVWDGGQDAFDDWGYLRLRIFDAGGALVAATGDDDDDFLRGFGLTFEDGHHWRTTTPVVTDTLEIARDLYAPASANWLRYVDTFTNTGVATRTVWVAWGGNLGSDDNTRLQDTSSGDGLLTALDTWAVTVEDGNPPINDPPVGHILRSPSDTTYQGAGIFDRDVFTDTVWPAMGEDELGHIYKLVLGAGDTASLAYFVYRGLAEGNVGPQDCEFYGDCLPLPAAGSQVSLAESTAAVLAAVPNFCELSQDQLDSIVNWPGITLGCPVALFLPLVLR